MSVFWILSIFSILLRSKTITAEEATTLAVGEEGGSRQPNPVNEPKDFTTQAIGEEGGREERRRTPGEDDFTTQAVGEEGGREERRRNPGDHEATTQAVGEEGGGRERPIVQQPTNPGLDLIKIISACQQKR